MAERKSPGSGTAPTVPVSAVTDSPVTKAAAPAPVKPEGPVRKFRCLSASSTILHPDTGVLILKSWRNEIRMAPMGTELYAILKSRVDWEEVGYPRRDVIQSASYKRVGEDAQTAGG